MTEIATALPSIEYVINETFKCIPNCIDVSDKIAGPSESYYSVRLSEALDNASEPYYGHEYAIIMLNIFWSLRINMHLRLPNQDTLEKAQLRADTDFIEDTKKRFFALLQDVVEDRSSFCGKERNLGRAFLRSQGFIRKRDSKKWVLKSEIERK